MEYIFGLLGAIASLIAIADGLSRRKKKKEIEPEPELPFPTKGGTNMLLPKNWIDRGVHLKLINQINKEIETLFKVDQIEVAFEEAGREAENSNMRYENVVAPNAPKANAVNDVVVYANNQGCLHYFITALNRRNPQFPSEDLKEKLKKLAIAEGQTSSI